MRSMGPRFDAIALAEAEKMELHASKFTDPGPDFMEYYLFDSFGEQISMKRTEGY